jgi:calcyclin binding protein
VKKNRITLKLRKTEGEFGTEHWTGLTKKRAHAALDSASKADPTSGLMDMMKDLYEDGDDNMRKTIGEAMLKSRQERVGADLGADF